MILKEQVGEMDDETSALEKIVNTKICSKESIATLSTRAQQDKKLQIQIQLIYERYQRDTKKIKREDVAVYRRTFKIQVQERIEFFKQLIQEKEEVTKQVLQWLENTDVSALFYTTYYGQLYGQLLIAKARGEIQEYRQESSRVTTEQQPFKCTQELVIQTNETTFNNIRTIEQKVDEILAEWKNRVLRVQEKDVDEIEKEKKEKRMKNFTERYTEIKTITIPERKYRAIAQLTRDVEEYYLDQDINPEYKDLDYTTAHQYSIDNELAVFLQRAFEHRDYQQAEKIMQEWMKKLQEEIKVYEKIIDEQIIKARKTILEGIPKEDIILSDFTGNIGKLLHIHEKTKEERISPTYNTIQRIMKIGRAEPDEHMTSALQILSWNARHTQKNEVPIPEDIQQSKTITYTIELSDKDPITSAPIEKDTNALTMKERKEQDPIRDSYSKIPSLLSDNATHILTIHQETDTRTKRRVGMIIGYEAVHPTGRKILLCEGIDVNIGYIPLSHIDELVAYAEKGITEYKKRRKFNMAVMLLWNNETSSIEGNSKKREYDIDMTGVQLLPEETIKIKMDNEKRIKGTSETEDARKQEKIKYYVVA